MAVLNRQGPPPGVPTDPAYYTWSIQRHLAAIDLSLMLLALIAVLGRLYIRVFVLRVFRLDDHLIVAAMVCSGSFPIHDNLLTRIIGVQHSQL